MKEDLSDSIVERERESDGGISEAERAQVSNVRERLRKDGKPWGYEKKERRLTPKMVVFTSGLAQGLSPKDAYKKAYDTSRMGDSSILSASNRLMKDSRISIFLDDIWNDVKENIIDDQIATRRKIMADLILHADNEKASIGYRLKALELMGRAIGLFNDRLAVSNEVIDTQKLKEELDNHAKRFENARTILNDEIIDTDKV